jgi:hypothetical protein
VNSALARRRERMNLLCSVCATSSSSPMPATSRVRWRGRGARPLPPAVGRHRCSCRVTRRAPGETNGSGRATSLPTPPDREGPSANESLHQPSARGTSGWAPGEITNQRASLRLESQRSLVNWALARPLSIGINDAVGCERVPGTSDEPRAGARALTRIGPHGPGAPPARREESGRVGRACCAGSRRAGPGALDRGTAPVRGAEAYDGLANEALHQPSADGPPCGRLARSRTGEHHPAWMVSARW